MESPGTGRKAATSNVDPFGLLIEYQFNYKKNMRYGTPETASASNTTPQLANMLGTANRFRKQITDVKQSIRGSNMIKNMGGGEYFQPIQAQDDTRHNNSFCTAAGRKTFQTRTRVTDIYNV